MGAFKEHRTMISVVQDWQTSLGRSSQGSESAGEHLCPATRQHIESHVTQAGEAVRDGFLEGVGHMCVRSERWRESHIGREVVGRTLPVMDMPFARPQRKAR